MTSIIKRPVVRLSGALRNQITELLFERSATTVRRRADQLGVLMVRHVQSIIAGKYINDRPARRRKGGPHLINSFTYKVEGYSLPIQVALTTKPGVNAKKVAALNYGYGPHPISAGKRYLVFPWAHKPGFKFAGAAAKFHAYGLPNMRVKRVMSPAQAGGHFMEKARLAAIRDLPA